MCGWTAAPVGYLASLKTRWKSAELSYDAHLRGRPDLEHNHFIRQGHHHTFQYRQFWPAMLKFSGRKTPTKICVHGFMTVNNGEKMSKSRGTAWTRSNTWRWA